MKTILLILLVGVMAKTEPELGLGVVEVDIYETKVIKIFKTKGDNVPEKIIHLINRNNEISIQETDYAKWLKPEAIWFDYSRFLFRYTQSHDNWLEVIINHETGNKKWIQKTESLNSHTWETFLVDNTTAIDPLYITDIKVEPNANSTTIRKSTIQDCFESIEIKGDWIKVRTNETLDCNEHPQPIKSGWIRWRENNQLTIKFYLSC